MVATFLAITRLIQIQRSTTTTARVATTIPTQAELERAIRDIKPMIAVHAVPDGGTVRAATIEDWLLVAPACDLTPTWAWSWNAGVPLNRYWVYF